MSVWCQNGNPLCGLPDSDGMASFCDGACWLAAGQPQLVPQLVSREDGSIAEGRERHPDVDRGTSGVSRHAQRSGLTCRIKTPAGIESGFPSSLPASDPGVLVYVRRSLWTSGQREALRRAQAAGVDLAEFLKMVEEASKEVGRG